MIENKNEVSKDLEKALQALEQAKAMLELAKQKVRSIQHSKIRDVTVIVKNEVLEMIAKVAERKGRLELPIVSGKHLRKISDRTALQSADNAEKFVTTRKIDSFESLAKFTADRSRDTDSLKKCICQRDRN